MPNNKQQAHRVRSAARQRSENLRWRSTAKTLFKRLQKAVEDGDTDLIDAEHRALVRWLDKAAAHRAIHPRRAARKKSQAAKLVAAGPE